MSKCFERLDGLTEGHDPQSRKSDLSAHDEVSDVSELLDVGAREQKSAANVSYAVIG